MKKAKLLTPSGVPNIFQPTALKAEFKWKFSYLKLACSSSQICSARFSILPRMRWALRSLRWTKQKLDHLFLFIFFRTVATRCISQRCTPKKTWWNCFWTDEQILMSLEEYVIVVLNKLCWPQAKSFDFTTLIQGKIIHDIMNKVISQQRWFGRLTQTFYSISHNRLDKLLTVCLGLHRLHQYNQYIVCQPASQTV